MGSLEAELARTEAFLMPSDHLRVRVAVPSDVPRLVELNAAAYPDLVEEGVVFDAGQHALLGIAHAAVQNRLSRVIAYSSIENTGLIVVGFGVALTGAGIGDRRLPPITTRCKARTCASANTRARPVW